MNLTVFGGAFDPLHNGHVAIVDHILAVTDVDQLVVVPTGTPVYKTSTFFSWEKRWQMVNAVWGKNDRVYLSDYESRRQSPSYTIDSVTHFLKVYGVETMTLVVGFDQLYQFHRWRRYADILAVCHLLVVLREGIDHQRLLGCFPPELAPFKGRIRIHEWYPPAISSTRLRIMLHHQKPIHDYVPASILPYL